MNWTFLIKSIKKKLFFKCCVIPLSDTIWNIIFHKTYSFNFIVHNSLQFILNPKKLLLTYIHNHIIPHNLFKFPSHHHFKPIVNLFRPISSPNNGLFRQFLSPSSVVFASTEIWATLKIQGWEIFQILGQYFGAKSLGVSFIDEDSYDWLGF